VGKSGGKEAGWEGSCGNHDLQLKTLSKKHGKGEGVQCRLARAELQKPKARLIHVETFPRTMNFDSGLDKLKFVESGAAKQRWRRHPALSGCRQLTAHVQACPLARAATR